mgnify:CR=1 FL=1
MVEKTMNDAYGSKTNSRVKKFEIGGKETKEKFTSERDCYVSLGNKSGTRRVQLRK